MALVKLIHTEDPRDAIMHAVGDSLDGFDIPAQGVLVATYKRPGEVKTQGGLLIAEEVVKDDEFQSKVGLVIKLGRRAFQDDSHVEWHGYHCEVGDWVVFRSSDGLRMAIGGPGGVHCRLISDVHLKMKVPHPDAVF